MITPIFQAGFKEPTLFCAVGSPPPDGLFNVLDFKYVQIPMSTMQVLVYTIIGEKVYGRIGRILEVWDIDTEYCSLLVNLEASLLEWPVNFVFQRGARV